ncbi:MarR family winged helix-turn-helix transcriptional regulator [Pseudomonas sp. BGr12]|uniref:MarR family winged helix-turn-helix transcriptional regulator n=1 Tax=unclassified Pseudomonas TaxID=196821 RepID=UPI001783D13B|nr:MULTISPECIES: MarR family transcriptional regulator [unclassified Pseudomonas]MBD9499845.1 MarR family transcriptional regulator [Pseudomonas sp. PDM17]MBD9575414.1 MarR family transcriptional regulator [Pseudomonas sp. PDM23]MBD9669644.1 MarR family transcriptional regulator [Pseudomonas sp. PDM21]MDL2428057.1 MarR family transcriptional regulator [Pseudomonas sp. BJa5]
MTDTTLYDYLERIASLMRAWAREQPLMADLQPIQLSALNYLARCNRYSNTPLGVTDFLGLTKGTVSQSLKALEAKGLIAKRPDAQDRRSVHLELTPEGRGLIDALAPPAFLRHAEESLGERSGLLVELLRELLATVQRQENVPGYGLCRTCRFHQKLDDGALCGLTGERLEAREGELICREHAAPDEAA